MPRKATPPAPTNARRTFTEEFRREAVQMLLDGHTATSVAERLGLSDATLLYKCNSNTPGLALFLRNLWQWLANIDHRWGTPPTKPTAPNPPRYQDVLDDFSDYLHRLTQTYQAPIPGT